MSHHEARGGIDVRTCDTAPAGDSGLPESRPAESPPDGIDGIKTEKPILSRPANRSTPAKLRNLLAAYSRTGRLYRACEIAGIGPQTHYRRLQSDPVYRQAFEEATEEVGQLLEDLAVDRAYDGDNHVLLALLKRFRPELYRERISTDTTITVNLVDRMTAANERLLTLRRSNAGEPDES